MRLQNSQANNKSSVAEQQNKYFSIKLSTIFLDVHDSLEKLGIMGATSTMRIISVIYKFRL